MSGRYTGPASDRDSFLEKMTKTLFNINTESLSSDHFWNRKSYKVHIFEKAYKRRRYVKSQSSYAQRYCVFPTQNLTQIPIYIYPFKYFY